MTTESASRSGGATVRRPVFDWLDRITKSANEYTEQRIFGRAGSIIFTAAEREVLRRFMQAVRDDEREKVAPRSELPRASENAIRLQCAGAIGLLCELSTQLRDSGAQRDEQLDQIEQCVSDWCDLTGWSYKRILHRIEVFPPSPSER